MIFKICFSDRFWTFLLPPPLNTHLLSKNQTLKRKKKKEGRKKQSYCREERLEKQLWLALGLTHRGRKTVFGQRAQIFELIDLQAFSALARNNLVQNVSGGTELKYNQNQHRLHLGRSDWARLHSSAILIHLHWANKKHLSKRSPQSRCGEQGVWGSPCSWGTQGAVESCGDWVEGTRGGQRLFWCFLTCKALISDVPT